MVRKLLVGSAQYILGPFGPDTDLRRYGLRSLKQVLKIGVCLSSFFKLTLAPAAIRTAKIPSISALAGQ
jgi:hypothetical protein